MTTARRDALSQEPDWAFVQRLLAEDGLGWRLDEDADADADAAAGHTPQKSRLNMSASQWLTHLNMGHLIRTAGSVPATGDAHVA